jgi:hypothetical protein
MFMPSSFDQIHNLNCSNTMNPYLLIISYGY